MINLEATTVHHHMTVTNKELITRAYHAWLKVKDEKLTSNYQTFLSICDQLQESCEAKLHRHPNTNTTSAETANVCLFLNRNQTIQISITVGYTFR